MKHVIAVLVENKPGVLARVSTMFARRGFNIHSLTVGPTEDPTLSRMTVVVDGPEMEQIVKQLYKLIHIVKVTELEPGTAIEREIMLVRVNADAKRRGEILDAARVSDAKAVDVGANTITFEVTGPPERLADFLQLMATYGIVALAKSGRIALPRDQKSTKKQLRSA
ncbi:MAG TPA: acetolactate synthase small subunit [Acidimicrobiia bacterium]|nr:acetolactate synthase small subunit [Acidimicrobiia bacterium]